MAKPTDHGPHGPNIHLVHHCRQEVHMIFKTLRQLNHETQVKSWSAELAAAYDRIMDELTVLELYLFLYILLQRTEHREHQD